MFTGGFLAAASTGMAGLVQAGYLTSSLLCIGEWLGRNFFSQLDVTFPRLAIWTVLTNHGATRQCSWYPRRRLWNSRIIVSCWLPSGALSAICWSCHCWCYNWCHHRSAHHSHRASPDGCSFALCRWSCSCVYLHRQCTLRSIAPFCTPPSDSLPWSRDWGYHIHRFYCSLFKIGWEDGLETINDARETPYQFWASRC